MTQARRITAALVLAGACCLAGAALLRGRAGAASGGAALETASPGVRFVSVALGGFRGLLADALWVRASGLQDEGRFYELVQLADWITQLEPRHAEVWAYHAWNLAYNIGAMFPDPRDKWRWISHGIRLLRDEGIPANPRDDALHWELGWLYLDKIGGPWEEAQAYHRVALAIETSLLFPEGRADAAVLNDPERAAALAASRLRTESVLAVDRAYGPLDWRLPATHALYWGYTGRLARQNRSAWCARLVYQGLLETVRGGDLRFDPTRRLYERGPRPDVAAKMPGTVAADPDALAHPVSAAPVENLLRECVLILHVFGTDTEAETARAALARLPGVTVEGTVDACVRRDLAERIDGVDAASVEELVQRLLERRKTWRGLGERGVAEGFERLARLHWQAAVERAQADSPLRREGAWESIESRARKAGRAAGEEGSHP